MSNSVTLTSSDRRPSKSERFLSSSTSEKSTLTYRVEFGCMTPDEKVIGCSSLEDARERTARAATLGISSTVVFRRISDWDTLLDERKENDRGFIALSACGD